MSIAWFSSAFAFIVMAGLVPAIHVLAAQLKEDVDARDKPAHDDFERSLPDFMDTVGGQESLPRKALRRCRNDERTVRFLDWYLGRRARDER